MSRHADIAVVGAGAAGLAAGIFAAETRPDLTVVLVDGARTIGAKIVVSGGGRCNVTNVRVSPDDFHAPKKIVERVIRRFDAQAAVRWFESLGVPLKEEAMGKLFPVTHSSRTVLKALLDRCRQLEVEILPRHRVRDIAPTDTGFQIRHESGWLQARRVIMATGGQSLPKTGSDGQGWSLVQRLGHTCTPTHPALVPLVLAKTFFHAGLSGISHNATVTTRVDGKQVDRRTGSLLWTHFGVSGPVVLDASRFWVMAKAQGRDALVSISCLPGRRFEEVDEWLKEAGRERTRRTVTAILSPWLPNRVVSALCTYTAGGAMDEARTQSSYDVGAIPVSRLSRTRRRNLTRALTDLALPVVKDRGWNYAEVTAGGVPLQEINPASMVSRKVPGLYLVGEMLDCDGRIGGFNFQWAWSTGYLAGRSAAYELSSDHA